MWTAERVQRLIADWNAGKKSATQIAHGFGPEFTRNSIIAKVWRLRRAGVFLRSNPVRAHSNQHSYAYLKRPRRAPTPRPSVNGLQPMVFGKPASPTPTPPVYSQLKPDTGKPKVVNTADLEPTHCRWPYGEPDTKDFGYCGANRVMGLSYCPAHAVRAFQPAFVREHPELSKFVAAPAPELEPAS
jgi:GcrA cell cycle regulator